MCNTYKYLAPTMNRGGRVEPTPPECALAAEMFDLFCAAGTMKQILALHREICATLNLKPNRLPDFYPKLKGKLSSSWKAQALFKKFDVRANLKVFGKGRACERNKVLIIGAGPCGLRAAIECQLLGAKVVVIEKRDRLSRNNVLHLWPFVIHDLKALGAKKFFGKFCAGSIDHISIRQLQCILLKVSLLLGVEIHEGVSFEEHLEPTTTEKSETLGWRARVSPAEHPVAQYEFDVLIGADGKRNTLQGFKRKEFRGKLAMAITANFINRHTEQEAAVPEISGVAYIFNQKFFKDLKRETGIDLENIVYYKDDTHYFVMTAKKQSLIDKGVLLNDYGEISRLLSAENMDRAALMRYAQEAARFSTDNRLPRLDFALNHYGEPDVALFDFTSMYAAENASMVYERRGRRLLCQLVGDSLLEPFWPTGSGCARGFLSALDAAWTVRAWGQNPPLHPLQLIAERESVYRLLAQTTPENLHRDFGTYTLDPCTRYPNLNRAAVTPHRVTALYDSDEPLPLDATPPAKRRRREPEISEEALVAWVGYSEPGMRAATSAPALCALMRRYRPDLLQADSSPRSVYSIFQHQLGIPPFITSESDKLVPEPTLRCYLLRVYQAFKGEVPHVYHKTDMFEQIKKSQQSEKSNRNVTERPYSNAGDTESHSSYRRKRRSLRPQQVSNDPAEYIRKKIGKLDLNDITQLARLIEGHDVVTNDEQNTDKQRELQEQILNLLDPEDSPDPKMLRDSLTQLLQGGTRSKVKSKLAKKLPQFFQNKVNEKAPQKPPRKLKGLDPDTIKVPDFDYSEDTDATVVATNFSQNSWYPPDRVKHKDFVRSASTETPLSRPRRLSEVVGTEMKRFSQSPETGLPHGRSNSIGSSEMAVNTKRMAQLFEGNERHTTSPEANSVRSRIMDNPEMALRWQRMADIMEGKRRDTPSPERSKRSHSIGNPELALRGKRVSDLIQGINTTRQSPEYVSQRRNSGEMAFRMQRVSDMMNKKNGEEKKPKSCGKRKMAREIMKQRFEKSLQMLAAEPRPDFAPSADLENDYGLQQYRASAPQFDERVKKLERKLQHYEEGRAVGGVSRAAGGGARVARLAAELAHPAAPAVSPPPSKPRDLMRSVGKIEPEDWNVKLIEQKIMENRLGRPERKTAEKVPKWDREQFLRRQRRLKEGDPNEDKWGDIDETIHKIDQQLNDSGRPLLGTKRVAKLATKFIKKCEPDSEKKEHKKEEPKKPWSSAAVAASGAACAACGSTVFAAEGVVADGLHLHRACFKCAVCDTILRPGNYTTELFGTRLVCLRHTGVTATDSAAPRAGPSAAPTATPERISLELSDGGAREIDEDEWTDRNFLASETSGAGGLSDEDESSSDEYTDAAESDTRPQRSPEPAAANSHSPRAHHIYFSDDSFGYDDYSDDGAESSGNESCSRMRAAREARRREVPAEARPPTDSSEVESEDESESSEEEISSATEVSTDSEFAREECAPAASPPAILVTEAPPPAPPPHHDYPLIRTRSAGGLATKRALELKRRYLLGEPSPPVVRKSDSTSQLDTKLEAFRSNITEIQKLLLPAPPQTQKPVVTFQLTTVEKKPMPDIIQNLCSDAPVDLLTKGDSVLCNTDWREPTKEENRELDIESDSLSDEDSSHTQTLPNQSVPRVEVHDEGGELIQLDSLMIISSSAEDNERGSGTATATGPTVLAAESESSDSCRDATTLALTETELSDWAAESVVLDDCSIDEKEDRKRSKRPRSLSGPKLVHETKNISAIASHVCGKTSPAEPIMFSNALDHFEFADEGDQDPSIETPVAPRNEGYVEFVDDEYDHYSPNKDRSMNFIERSFSETTVKPYELEESIGHDLSEEIKYIDDQDSKTESLSKVESLKSSLTQTLISESSENVVAPSNNNYSSDVEISTQNSLINNDSINNFESKSEFTGVSDKSQTIENNDNENRKREPKSNESKSEVSLEDISPPLASEKSKSQSSITYNLSKPFANPCSIRMYAPAICRSASETFNNNIRIANSPTLNISLSPSYHSVSTVTTSPTPERETIEKVQELKKEREEQTEVVRRLVLERLGSGQRAGRKSARRHRAAPGGAPPPVPPPPAPSPPPPPRPAPPLAPLPVSPSLSDSDLTHETRRKGIMRSISNYFNKRLGPRQKNEPQSRHGEARKSTGALQEAPPVPPPPAIYSPPANFQISPANQTSTPLRRPGAVREGREGERAGDEDERDAMQLWFEARWARLVAQRRAREESRDEPGARRLARLQRRLSRPLSAEQQAATVAEVVQVSAQRDAHQALAAANRQRHSSRNGVGH
ncbi:F-actin-monooxygenase Mical isoform X2 [Maniola jurtina]|uniref:F-actin-monooxygenase Mical isoform X2 n=1 Tax=Maniola jurtina TaxID=191418 RepID=UPI001E68C3FF|nr:F-actin-monooxygenase Mical isoform X2 [Maniola jurtina]